MADWSKASLAVQSENPAAPEGLQQQASRFSAASEAAEQAPSRWGAASEVLQPWAPPDSYTELAQSWYGGQNTQGVNNGFDNEFMRQTFEYIGQKEAEAGRTQNPTLMWDMWDTSRRGNEQATGVATWDDPTGRGRWKVGDVFEQGVKREGANLYESFDRGTANLMIADFMLTAEEKQRIFRDSERDTKLDNTITQRTAEQTETARSAPAAWDFSMKVAGRQEDWEKSNVTDLGSAAIGAGGGALTLGATGAAIGTFLMPGLGTGLGFGIGAGIGTAAGAISGWLNKDQLSEVAARATEVSSRAYDRYGFLGGTATATEEFAGLANRALMPTSNAFQGIYDAVHGELGDGESEFYAVDETGARKAGALTVGLDIAASFTDSMLQFASPVGRMSYMFSTGMAVSGGTASLATGGTFNPRVGDFDKYETVGEWTAAVGSIGIDAIQMGQSQALYNAARSAQARLLGRPGVQGQQVTMAGTRFTLDAQGKAIDSAMTLERLVPSEMLRYIPAKMKARTQALRADGRAVTHDDLYVAARSMTDSGSRWRDALMMGYTEGVEEGVQAALDPLAVSEGLDPSAIFEASLYGGAAGMGMSLGRINRPPSNADQLKARARLNYMSRTGTEVTEAEWNEQYKKLSPLERERMAQTTPAEAAEYLGHAQFHEGMMRTDMTRSSVLGAAVASDFMTTDFDAALKKINPAVDSNLVLLGRTSFHQPMADGLTEVVEDPNVGVMSAFEVVNTMRKKVMAHETQLQSAQRRLEAATDPDERTQIQAQVDQLEAQVGITQEVFNIVKGIYDNRLTKAPDEAAFRVAIDQMNNALHNAATGNWSDRQTRTLLPEPQQELYRRAGEIVMSRHPYIDTGSFARLIPQVSFGMTANNAHTSIGVFQGILKPTQGDHDGDRFASINMAYLTDERLRDLRRGTQMAEKAAFNEETGEDSPATWAMDDPDGEPTTVREFSQYLWNYESLEAQAVLTAILNINKRITDTYTKLDAKGLRDLLIQFELDMRAGNAKARSNLLNGMLRLDPETLIAYGDEGSVPVALQLQSLVSAEFDTAQKAIAALGMVTNTAAPEISTRRPDDRAFQQNISRRAAATAQTDLGMLGSGDNTRDGQMLWYTSFQRAAVNSMDETQDAGFRTQQQAALTQLYIELGDGDSRSQFEKVTNKHSIENRVLTALKAIHRTTPSGLPASPEALILLAQSQVPNITYNEKTGEYAVEPGEITLLQLLLRKSLQVEKNLRRGMPQDAAINMKIRKLEAMTRAQKSHSYSASTALLEIFGSEQLINLLGSDAKYLGQQMTLLQRLNAVKGMHEVNRNREIRAWRSSPAYAHHHGKGNPPFRPSDFAADPDSTAVPLNAFTMVVDALAAGVNTQNDAREDADTRAHESMKTLLGELKSMVDVHARTQDKRLRQEGKAGNRRAVLEDLLNDRNDVAAILAPIIPKAIALGAFEVVDGRIYAANWVMEVLTNPDAEKAALIYHVYSGFTEFNMVGGGLDLDALEKGDLSAQDATDAVATVDPSKLKTHFAQTIYRLAAENSGVELARFLKATRDAPTLQALYDKINAEPTWRGNRTKLMPYHQDIAETQSDPSTQFVPNLPGAVLREALTEAAQRMAVVGAATFEEATNRQTDQIALTNMLEFVRSGTSKDNADQLVGLLHRMIANARMAMDSMGQAARDQYLEVVQGELARTDQKAKADPRVAPVGDWRITADTFGLKQGWGLELDALTSLDWDDVRSNLTKLMQGPVRLQRLDGAETLIDMTDPETLIMMLLDDRTSAFAKAVLRPTVRDVNNVNVLQHYTDTDHPGSFVESLKEASHANLFREQDTHAKKLKQATRYLNFIEASVRQNAFIGSADKQADAFLPITNTLAEFLQAYTHGPGGETQNRRMTRERLVIEVADALKGLASLPARRRPAVMAEIKAKMIAFYEGDFRAIDALAEKSFEDEMLDELWQNKLLERFGDIRTETGNNIKSLQTELSRTTDPKEQERIQERLKEEKDRDKLALANYNALQAKNWSDLRLEYNSVESTINQYLLTDGPTQSMTQQDWVDANNLRKTRIRDFLEHGMRKERFRDADGHVLIEKLRYVTHEGAHRLFDETYMSREEWNILAHWAASAAIAEGSTRSASDIKYAPLVSDTDAHVRRYYDVSWGYLVDGLFNTEVMKAAEYMNTNAHFPKQAEADVVSGITSTLLNPQRLGAWSDRVPVETLKARRLLDTASVGLAAPVAGIIPKTTMDQVGVGWVTYGKPDPAKHHSIATVAAGQGMNLGQLVDPLERNKLDNHFVQRVTLKHPVAGDVDITKDATFVATATTEVEASGYTVLQISRLQSAMEKALDGAAYPFGYTIEIEYVDVDKTPYEKDYVNSIYFDGVGPGAALSTTSGGPIAQSIFGTGGWSKIGQQSIFDVAARGGSGFTATATSPLQSALELEDDARYPTIAAKLLAKVNHMWGKSYDIGHMSHEDRPALYKLIKQRHVVIGKGADGQKRVMWSAEYISREANGEDTGFVGDVKLHALNETVAATLLSDSTINGKPDIMTKPELNVMDVDPQPSLDAARLERLGLERLGETAAWNEEGSPLFNQVALPKAYVSEERGAAIRTAYEEKVRVWTEEAARVHAAANARLGWSQQAQTIRDRNRQNLEQMLEKENLAWLMAKLNIPFPQMREVAAAEISQRVVKNLDQMTGGNTGAIFWEYEQGKAGDLAVGVLSPDLINNDFEFMKDRPPVYGDFVNIKLDSFLDATGNIPAEAQKQAMQVIRQFAKRGVTVALSSDKGDTGLRSMLTDWMQTGAVGYRPLANSAHIFTPMQNDSDYGTTRMALLSTLGAVNHFTGTDVTVKFLSDVFGQQGASEGTTFVDFNNSEVRTKAAHQLLPMEIVDTQGAHSRQPMLYGIPVTDLDGRDQMKYVMQQTLLMLKDPDVRKHIKGLTNEDRKPKKADPQNVNHYRKVTTPGGQVIIEPGVLDIESAMTRLVAQFEAGEYPIGQGKELQIGQLIPMLANDGKTIYFARVGYKIPKGPDMGKQRDATYNGRRLNVTIATNELNEGMTVLPPFTQVEDPVRDANGLSIIGQYDLNKYGKWVEETLGFKEGVVKLEHYAFPEQGLSNEEKNDLRVTEGSVITAQVKKRALRGVVNDFRSLFSFTGVDFRDIMIDFFWGDSPGPRSQAEFEDLWAKTETILNRIAKNDYGMTMEAVAEMMSKDSMLEFLAREVNVAGEQFPGWNPVIFDAPTPQQEVEPKKALATKLIQSLLAPGVKLEHVIATPGLMTVPNLKGDSQITEMPYLFTDSLWDVNAPKLRDMLIQMSNAHMPTDDNNRPLYRFTNDFRFHMQMQPLGKDGNPSGPMEWQSGWAQMILPQPADENISAYSQAAISEKKDETSHLVNVMNGALAARLETASDPHERFGKRYDAAASGIMRFNDLDTDGERGTFWEMLTRIPADPLTPWDKLSPMQWAWVKSADTRVGQYIRPLDKTDDVKWPSPEQAAERGRELLTQLGLTDHIDQELVEVDYLVRQFLGRPAPAANQVDYTDDISQDMYMQVVAIMIDNVKENLQPLHGGAVPMPRKDLWWKIYQSNNPASGGWAPAASVMQGRTTSRKLAKSWDEWVTTLVGQMRDSNAEFHSMYRLDLDGMWHSYQGSTGSMKNIGISTSEAIELGLMDPETNEYYLSLDVGQDVLLREPMLLDTMRMSMDALAGYTGDFEGSTAQFVPRSVLSEQLKRQQEWLRTKKIPKQEKMTFRQYMNEGAVYIDSSRATTPFFSGLVNLSIFTRLLNPALYVSAFIEVPVRNSMEHAVNLLTGSHIGFGGQAIAKAGLAAGIEPVYNEAQIAGLRQLARQMGQSNEFLALLYEDITFRNFVERGHGGKVSSKLEWMAAASARVSSDPRFGMKASSIATRYLQGALEYYAYTDASFTIEQLVQKMEQDPLYIQKMSASEGPGFSAHQAGMNRVAQVRSIKATALSQSIMAPIDAMTSSGSAFWNATGHLLKIPFLFTRFNANAFMALSGLNGMDQMVAMILEGRKKPGFINNMLMNIKGESPDRANQYFDMSDVLEGLDLSRPFTRMAVTQTGLMAAMFMAQGLGLGGEDEEMRKRRALMKYLDGPLYLDPREMQNDFLTADAMFLDNFSFLGLNTMFKDANGRSAVVPHWIIRQFTAPMMGMQKFFETGNIREIGYGFNEAISVLPLSVQGLIGDANLTAELLAQAAADEDLDVTIESQNSVSQLLIRLAGIYEKALIENSFVNAVRNGADAYNRNPWLVPQTDDIGRIVHAEGRNNMPLRTDALVAYNDQETGENKAAYRTRAGMDAQAHQYAENNLTFALLASLFTGQAPGQSTFMRDNMVVAEKSVPLPEQTRQEAEALLFAAYSANPQVEMTLDEITRSIKKKYEDADIRWVQSDVEKMAEAEFAARSDRAGATTVLNNKGEEIITNDGARGVYTGLRTGMLDFASPALQGLYIPWEMREAIDEQWASEIIQEGIDLGLNRDAAGYRMRRLMNGDPQNPSTPSIRDLIYDTRIPTRPFVKYNQLNMTFMIGPDGRPWATPFARQSVAQALGWPGPHTTPNAGAGMSTDDTRGKLVDDVLGINLGLHGLERKQQEPETRERTDDPLLRAEAKTYTPGSSGSAWRTFPKRSYGSRGYGSSGYSSSARPYFQRMQNLPSGWSVAPGSIGQINVNTPYVRRASVREERISSQRGRLKQWQ